MSDLKLCIGMAVYDDLPGVWMTVQALRLYHPDVLSQCELIVVDNHPASDHGKSTENLIRGWVRGDFLKVRYVPFTDFNSTAKPRQMVFDLAEAPNVLVIDSHIMLPRAPGEESSLARLIRYYDQHPDTMNLLQGPMLYDNARDFSTHFQDVIREEMWGIWGVDVRGGNSENEPFEIPAHGLGLFSARKEAWDKVGGFNPNFRGFGGEEWYIHTKFRQHGEKNSVDGRTLCLPFLKWLHRFGHAGGVKYPLTVLDKLRNYVIGYRELGLSLPRLANHFIGMNNEDGTKRVGPPITVDQWNAIVRDPNQYPIRFDKPVAAVQARPGYVANPNPQSCGDIKVPSPDGVAANTTAVPVPATPAPEMIPSDLDILGYTNWLKTRPDGYSNLYPQLRPYLDAKRTLFILKDRIEPVLSSLELTTERRVILNNHDDDLAAKTLDKLMTYFRDSASSVLGIESDIIELWQDFSTDKKFTALPEVFQYMTQLQHVVTKDPEAEEMKTYYDTCDCVVIQGWHNATYLWPLLDSLKEIATGRIIIYGTSMYSEAGPGFTKEAPVAGIRPVVRKFCEDNPAWGVVTRIKDGVGAVVLSRLAGDRKKLPSTLTMAVNLAKATTAYVASGLESSTPEENRTRLAICSDCEYRAEDRCSECGCYLVLKAAQAVSECPLGFWKNPELRQLVTVLAVESADIPKPSPGDTVGV